MTFGPNSRTDHMWKKPTWFHSFIGDLGPQAAAEPFPPSTTDPRNFGIDLSVWNNGVDYEAVGAFNNPPIEYVFCRLGISWGYQDPTFATHWDDFKQYTDIPRMAYHVPYPGEDIQEQINNIADYFDRLGGDMGEGPIWSDSELDHGLSRSQVTDFTGEFTEKVAAWFNKVCGMYTYPYFFIDHMLPYADWYPQREYWIAQYYYPELQREHEGPPMPIPGIDPAHIVFHQTSSWVDGNLFGAGGNSPTGRVDANRYMWYDRLPLNEYFGLEPPPPPPNGDLENRVLRLEQDVALLQDELSDVRGRIERAADDLAGE